MEIDHDRRVVYTETLALAGQDRELLLAAAQPTEEQVLSRLTAPVVTTQLDTKNISFERWVGMALVNLEPARWGACLSWTTLLPQEQDWHSGLAQ